MKYQHKCETLYLLLFCCRATLLVIVMDSISYWLSMKLSFGYDWSNMCPHAPYTGISKKLQGWADDLLKDLMRSPFLIHMPESQTPQVFGETLKLPDSHFTQCTDPIGILLFRASS